MSDTSRSARADSTKALFSPYSFTMQMLDNIVQDNQQKAECRQQARGLLSTMTKLAELSLFFGIQYCGVFN